MKIDCFICNPPFGDSKNPNICCKILNKMKNYRAVIIATPPSVFRSLYFHITTLEKVVFPLIHVVTIIITMNDNKENMFKKQYRYIFSSTPTKFYIQIRQNFVGCIKTKYGLKIRKIGVEKECNKKYYLNITDEERNFINKLIDETDITFWSELYGNSINGPRFLVPNLLSKTKYAYLVKEVKNNDD